MPTRNDLESALSGLLQPGAFKDYGPNGLQVEGVPEVRRVATGVTASRALIDAAIEAGADTLLVHHGLFWRGQDGRLVGWLGERVRRLMRHDLNLFAYHLPLDAHPTLGNNAQWGAALGFTAESRTGEGDLVWVGRIGSGAGGEVQGCSLDALTARVAAQTGRAPLAVPGDGRPLRRVAWCTGGAQSAFDAAIQAGVDVYLTGEISEPQAHLAAETGVAYLACGHHASERLGVRAVGDWLAQQFPGLGVVHIERPNPA